MKLTSLELENLVQKLQDEVFLDELAKSLDEAIQKKINCDVSFTDLLRSNDVLEGSMVDIKIPVEKELSLVISYCHMGGGLQRWP
jgi:hypothetical protein